MDISRMVYAIIAIVVVVLVVASVLLPTIEGLNLDNTTYTTLFTVVGTLCIIVPVMMAVRLIGGRD